jgi:hypothetical protein
MNTTAIMTRMAGSSMMMIRSACSYDCNTAAVAVADAAGAARDRTGTDFNSVVYEASYLYILGIQICRFIN